MFALLRAFLAALQRATKELDTFADHLSEANAGFPDEQLNPSLEDVTMHGSHTGTATNGQSRPSGKRTTARS